MSRTTVTEAQPQVLRETSLGGLTPANRAVVAPMSRVSATVEGVPTGRMAAYYRSFAEGGFGLIITEGVFTDAVASRAYARQPGLVTDAHAAGWRHVVREVHRTGTPMVAQLMHAGALSQTLPATLAPSAVTPRGEKMPAYGGSGPFPTPRAMTPEDIDRALAGFAQSAAQAVAAGFDGVEIHGANGYLVDQFLTDYTNRRSDRYGGSASDRARFPAEVVRAVRRRVGAEVPVGIRLSQGKVNDPGYRWPGGADEAKVLFTTVADAGADFLHIASEGRGWAESAALGSGGSITRLAREVTGLPVIANGGMHDPGQTETVLRDGHADLVSLGRGALADPDWPDRIRTGRELAEFDGAMLAPSASLENTEE